MASKDALGDRMKDYEKVSASVLDADKPIIVRCDGRAFHTFCRGLKKPFDPNFSMCMAQTAKKLLGESEARVAYTQSDEISLVMMKSHDKSEAFFNGKVQKLVSNLASIATGYFNYYKQNLLPEKGLGFFDCRVFNVPNKEEAINYLIWREMDARKNSVSMAASHYISHKKLHGKSTKERKEMLLKEGIRWEDYPTHFRMGCYFQRVQNVIELDDETRNALPKKHHAHKTGTIIRHSIQELIVREEPKYKNREFLLEGCNV
jgi:tRNA(His) guanylyltransferase